MDNWSYGEEKQTRGQPWDRKLHARLLEKLADAGCPLVVLDIFFSAPLNDKSDQDLAEQLRRLSNVVLMAKLDQANDPKIDSVHPRLPLELFLTAARTNYGVAQLDQSDLRYNVRRHWPFPAPGTHESLSWKAARLMGTTLFETPQEQWIRYYSQFPDRTLSYSLALQKAADYFRGKIVFIGNKPATSRPDDGEQDEFRTPFTRWTGESAGGVEIIAATFLNLVNNEWLRRPKSWIEAGALIFTGVLLGAGVTRFRPAAACGVAGALAIGLMLGAPLASYFADVWFPWLIVAGGQVPCALAWIAALAVIDRRETEQGYEFLCKHPFGEGTYGKVWVVRNAIGQFQALKRIYQSDFGEDSAAYETEFKGIQNYKPISDHDGLLHVDFVNKPAGAGYFYYVMELGDTLVENWKKNPCNYKPRTLASVWAHAPKNRMPIRQCVETLLPLAEALDFLHQQGLTHRDIKPENIIFVNGRPKLADVGLVTQIRTTAEQTGSRLGTLPYMPPWPERVATVAADIYGLGMVLYVISTGRSPGAFPGLKTTLIEGPCHRDFLIVNGIIDKACQQNPADRYASAAEMHADLLSAQAALGPEPGD
jgi:CHASE2 domain-containing sensor protein